jgi:phosphopantetheinyl transferase
MIIYYTHSYSNKKGESRELLTLAIARHLAVEAGYGTMASARNIEGTEYMQQASGLVSRITTSGEFGKPCIPGFAPFSVSHSAGTWAVLIGDRDGRPCGLDIQYERRAEALSVARRFYAPDDAAYLENLAAVSGETGAEVTDEFFRLWARREALVKAAGGSVAGSDTPSVIGERAVYCGTGYAIQDIEIPAADRIYAAVCVEAVDDISEAPEITEL